MSGRGDRPVKYTYGAFGTVRTHTGASTQWTFTGEQNDPTGLEYLRARYYDPAIGRFLTQDPIGSLNRYAYALNNPLRWIDPWGLRNLEGTPTPTPAGMVQVCLVGPQGCEPTGLYVEIPHGGNDWSLLGAVKSAAEAYWEHTPDHWVYQHVARPAWEFATSREPGCYERVGILGAVTLGFILETPEGAPLWSGPAQSMAYQNLVTQTVVSCSVTR